jgi:hypothetical protein
MKRALVIMLAIFAAPASAGNMDISERLALTPAISMPASTEAPAPDIMLAGSCTYCGCRGGPGWRIKRTGKCASKSNLYKECGKPPSKKLCVKEN